MLKRTGSRKFANGLEVIRRPRRFGVITKVHKKGISYQVKWHERSASARVRTRDIRIEKRKLTSAAVLSIMIMAGKEARFEAPDKTTWPKDFFDALVRSDWREWISAVKMEKGPWLAFGTYVEISISE